MYLFAWTKNTSVINCDFSVQVHSNFHISKKYSSSPEPPSLNHSPSARYVSNSDPDTGEDLHGSGHTSSCRGQVYWFPGSGGTHLLLSCESQCRSLTVQGTQSVYVPGTGLGKEWITRLLTSSVPECLWFSGKRLCKGFSMSTGYNNLSVCASCGDRFLKQGYYSDFRSFI